jgi:Protein of unknown function (DUF3108)
MGRARHLKFERSGGFRFAPFSAALIFAAAAAHSFAASWQATVSKDPPGGFPPMRPLRATYVFGWSGLTAATADVRISQPSQDRTQLEGTARTTGLARALWKYDVSYHAVSDASTLRPVETSQTEAVRSKKMITRLAFTSLGVTRARSEGPGAGTTKTKEYRFPNLFDLESAMLYLRSQSLKEKSSYRVVVYPATNAYLATVTVLGREKISVRAGSYNTIKLDLQLSKVGKNDQLEPHKKFRRANIWISDDPDRLILRVEGQIFVGTIFVELQSVRFDGAKP